MDTPCSVLNPQKVAHERKAQVNLKGVLHESSHMSLLMDPHILVSFDVNRFRLFHWSEG